MEQSISRSGTVVLAAVICACGSPFTPFEGSDAGVTDVLAVSVTGCCGKVTSTPAGIDCPGTACTASFASGTRVTLAADAAPFSALVEWGGSCSKSGPCFVRMDSPASISATFGPGPATLPLAVAAFAADAVTPGRTNSYSVGVIPGSTYSASLVGLSDDAAFTVYDEHTYPAVSCGGAAATGAPGECRFAASASAVYLVVSPAPESRGRTSYVASVARVPVVPSPVSEGTHIAPVAVAAGTATVGQVATRGTSFYTAALDPGRSHVVAITGLTGAADLHVFPDATFSSELDCTLRRTPDVLPVPQDCSVTAPGSIYFSVTSGAINRDGAAYEIMVL